MDETDIHLYLSSFLTFVNVKQVLDEGKTLHIINRLNRVVMILKVERKTLLYICIDTHGTTFIIPLCYYWYIVFNFS